MNKRTIAAALVLAAASTAFAQAGQDADATETVEYSADKYKVETNRFWSNWFISVGAGGQVFFGDHDKQASFGDRIAPALDIAVGKWFTPGIGLRTKVSGIWGKANDQSFKYWNAQEQVLFNLSNMLCGYNPDRVWNVVPFAGAGFARNCDAKTYAMALSVGLLNQFYVSRKVAINLELGWNRYENDLCGVTTAMGEGITNHPNNVYAEVGVTYRLGRKTWEHVPDMDLVNELTQSQLDALNAMLADERTENERLNNELASRQETPSGGGSCKAATAKVSVFFNLNEDVIASDKDLVDVSDLAERAAADGLRVKVTGYADSATGSAGFNRELSRRRAEHVADELFKMGVSRDRITIVAEGGVDTLVPPPYNRRATVEIIK